MSLRIPHHITVANADWDVEAELQKELDAVSICSYVSSSSSSTGVEVNLPADDAARTNNPLHKLLEDWRVKERKLHSFETMLSGTHRLEYDFLDRNGDQGQKPWPGRSYDPQDTYKEVQGLLDPIFQHGGPASKEIPSSQIDSMTLGETSTSTSSISPQCPSDVPLPSFGTRCPRFEISERVGRSTESHRQLQEHETMPTILISNCASQDFERAEDKSTRSHPEENDFPCGAMDYEDTLSMLRKKRMGMLEEYRAAEAERLVGKNLKRQRETEQSRKILLLASQRHQELENEIWKEKQDKMALLDLELAKRIESFEELQRTEERDIDIQILDMECRSRSIIKSVDTNRHQEEGLELRRLEKDKTIALTADQENKHEQAVQTAPEDHFVKCCVLIQSWIRGFICRRNYQVLKYQNAHALVSLLLPIYANADIQAKCGQEYPISEEHEDTGTRGLSEEPITVIQAQEYEPRGAQKEHGSIIASQDGTHINSESPEEILTILIGLAESGSMQDFTSCLDLATSYGLIDEASEVEAQLTQRKGNVQGWLEQVVHGWEIAKSRIEIEIQEAKRLEMFPIVALAEAVVSARETEIHENLEAAVLQASRRNYSYWMCKAKNFGLEDTLEKFSKSFQRKVKMVRNSLKREAKLGTKEQYVVMFKNAISLGLQLDVKLALKVVLKRVLQVFKRAIMLECSSLANVDSKERDWNRVEMEGAEIGLDSHILARLRQTIGAGRSFESVQRIWVNTFKANDTGGPFTICHGKYCSVEVAVSVSDASERQLSGNSHQFSIPAGISLSTVSGGAVTTESKTIWSLPQNWPEINRLQQDWQEHTLNLRNAGNANSTYSQRGGYSRRERDSLPTRFSRESTTNPTVTKNFRESVDHEHRPVGCLNSDKDSREGEEGSAELSESEEHLRGVGQGHLSEMLEHQKVTARSILRREMLEKKAGCNRMELSLIMKLDLTDEHLKLLGRANIFRWCPRLKFLTIDMNKLTTLRGAFQGGEDLLEELSVKDNLLRDMAGLECLGKVNVLHLDGNLLSQLGFPLSNPILGNENGKKERNANMNVKSKNCSSQPHPFLGFPVVEYCWPRLKVLTVGRNRLTKLLKIGNLCPNLEVLDVGSNQIFSLGGTEDNSLIGLHHLRVLDVGQNRLQGRSLWKGLENCPELVSLVASRNKLRELPTHFGSVLLREIWLNGNSIRRLSCKAWLPSLQRLYLQDNMIDSLESLWGCPALEVLDLSFNSISDLFHLRHLSCFPCLRSLQLNDNPVSEQEDHTTYVLQAVPWLAELDNEAVAKASRERAVTKIFKRIMDVVGLEFLKEKLSRGELLLRGFSNPLGPERCTLNSLDHSGNNSCQSLPQQEVNKVLNGEADEGSLWEVLSEVKSLASSSSIIKNLLSVNADMVKFEGLHNFSESELEARSNMIAYKQMTVGLKGRLHAATKETCIARLLKERDRSVPCNPNRAHLNENSCPVVPFPNLSSESRLRSARTEESNLELCLEEHTAFDSNTGREIYSENRDYKLQEQTQIRRVVRLQALARGYMTRIRVRLLKEQKAAMCQEQEDKCARKIQAFWRCWKVRRACLLDFLQRAQFFGAVTIQAHWRGHCIRRRFQRALDMAKYVDNDDFEYGPIDDSEFLAGEVALSALNQPTEGILSALRKSSVFASKTMDENIQKLPVNEGFKPAEWNSMHGNDFQEANQLPCPFEHDTKDAGDAAALVHEVEIDFSHGMEVSQGTFPAETLSLEDTERRISPKDKICATQLVLQEKPTGPEILEESEKKEETKEGEKNDITDLLERIGIKPNPNLHADDSVSEGIDLSEEVCRIVKGRLEGVSTSSGDPKDNKITDARDPSSIPAAEVKKRATVDELTKDWGFKNERTAQALLKARQRTQQQARDAAHRNILQDPVKRLKRFKEKVQTQAPALGALTRQIEKRASLSFSGLTLQMPVEEQESYTLPESAILHKGESNVRKVDGSSCPLPVPQLTHQQKKKHCGSESIENKKDMRKYPTKRCTRDLSAMHLSTVVLNTALQVPPFNNL